MSFSSPSRCLSSNMRVNASGNVPDYNFRCYKLFCVETTDGKDI